MAGSGVSGLIMTGPDTETVRSAVNELANTDIPVITINSDIRECIRLCFVGQDLRKSGVVAAELMAKLVRVPGRVVALTGNLRFQAHRDRIVGFREGFDSYQGTVGCMREAFAAARADGAGIAGIYTATGSIHGCRHVMRSHGVSGKIRLITNDVLPVTRQALASGEIDFTILQDPVHQGYAPVKRCTTTCSPKYHQKWNGSSLPSASWAQPISLAAVG